MSVPGPFLPVVISLLAVVLQVGDVMVEPVGVVAAAFTPDQTLCVTCCTITTILHVSTGSGICVPSLVPATALDVVDHHHLAGAVSAQMLHELLFVLSLEVTRLTVERLPFFCAAGTFADFAVLIRGFAGWRAGPNITRRVFNFVPIILASSCDHRVDLYCWIRRLGVLDDTKLFTVLVVISVPEKKTRQDDLVTYMKPKQQLLCELNTLRTQ